jgi:hypothetical protein
VTIDNTNQAPIANARSVGHWGVAVRMLTARSARLTRVDHLIRRPSVEVDSRATNNHQAEEEDSQQNDEK